MGYLQYCKQRKAASTAGVVDIDEVFHCAGVHGEDRGGLPRRLRNKMQGASNAIVALPVLSSMPQNGDNFFFPIPFLYEHPLQKLSNFRLFCILPN